VSWSTTQLLACADEHLITARSWQRFDISAFRSALSSSVICADPTGFANNHSVEDLYAAYSSTLTDLLDQHAPHVTVESGVHMAPLGLMRSADISRGELEGQNVNAAKPTYKLTTGLSLNAAWTNSVCIVSKRMVTGLGSYSRLETPLLSAGLR
jgi:hypothetical protein